MVVSAGTGSTWGFGMPMAGGGGGAPGLSNQPARTNTFGNFAQAIGGGASSQGPLDLSYVCTFDPAPRDGGKEEA